VEQWARAHGYNANCVVVGRVIFKNTFKTVQVVKQFPERQMSKKPQREQRRVKKNERKFTGKKYGSKKCDYNAA